MAKGQGPLLRRQEAVLAQDAESFAGKHVIDELSRQRRGLGAGVWAAPALLAAALLALSGYALSGAGGASTAGVVVTPKQVGLSLYRDYLIAVELASLLLVAGLVGAFHLAPPTRRGAEAASAATEAADD